MLTLAAVLAVSMFPQVSIVSPLFLVLRTVGLIDTFPGLVLPYLTFASRSVSGCSSGSFGNSPLRSRRRPCWTGEPPACVLERRAAARAAGPCYRGDLDFLYSWNEFLLALSFTLGPERQTVPVAIALFRGQYQVAWGEVLVGALVAELPVAVLVLIAQRRIVSGLTSGAVKG